MNTKYLILTILISSMNHLNAFPTNWFEDAMHTMRETMREMEEHFNHMQTVFAESMKQDASAQAIKQAKPSNIPYLSDQVIDTDDTTHIFIDNVEGSNDGIIMSAQLNDNAHVLTIKGRNFTAQIKPMQYRTQHMIMVQLDIEQKEESTDDNHVSHTFYSSSHVESIQVKNPIDLEDTKLSYDENTKRLTISFAHKQKKLIPIDIKRAS